MTDTHVHTKYSFDGHDSADAIAEAAAARGLSDVIITDHCDIDGMEDGIYPALDLDSSRREIEAANEKFAGKTRLHFGLELGQAYLRPDSARRLTEKYNFEFIIGSVHNLEGVPDFCFIKFEEMTEGGIDNLYRRYLADLKKCARFPGISTVAHVTYPLRYLNRAGRDIDISRYYGDYRELFHIMIESGVPMEINTSGLRRGYTTLPNAELIALYRSEGGTLFTVGSDAHFAADVGKFEWDRADGEVRELIIANCGGQC